MLASPNTPAIATGCASMGQEPSIPAQALRAHIYARTHARTHTHTYTSGVNKKSVTIAWQRYTQPHTSKLGRYVQTLLVYYQAADGTCACVFLDLTRYKDIPLSFQLLNTSDLANAVMIIWPVRASHAQEVVPCLTHSLMHCKCKGVGETRVLNEKVALIHFFLLVLRGQHPA